MSEADSSEYIGTCTMSQDRTLTLRLKAEAEDGTVGLGTLTYTTDNPRYAMILAHVAPLSPGQTVLVRPFDD